MDTNSMKERIYKFLDENIPVEDNTFTFDGKTTTTMLEINEMFGVGENANYLFEWMIERGEEVYTIKEYLNWGTILQAVSLTKMTGNRRIQQIVESKEFLGKSVKHKTTFTLDDKIDEVLKLVDGEWVEDSPNVKKYLKSLDEPK